jgi:hypothetical protein
MRTSWDISAGRGPAIRGGRASEMQAISVLRGREKYDGLLMPRREAAAVKVLLLLLLLLLLPALRS